MGNAIGGKKTTKVMKINGEAMKLKTPICAGEVLKDHPGHVLLESEAVMHYGLRAKPLEQHQNLKPKRLYFLIELPNNNTNAAGNTVVPRRVRSGIVMSAKDRLESLMLARRSVSDLSIINKSNGDGAGAGAERSRGQYGDEQHGSSGAKRVKVRLPKAEVEKLISESKDDAEAAEKIMNLYRTANYQNSQVLGRGEGDTTAATKKRERKVSFRTVVTEGPMPIAVAS